MAMQFLQDKDRLGKMRKRLNLEVHNIPPGKENTYALPWYQAEVAWNQICATKAAMVQKEAGFNIHILLKACGLAISR